MPPTYCRDHEPSLPDYNPKGSVARQAGMSRRTIIRRFHADAVRPPMCWLLDARLRLARELLESSDLRVEAVARRCGPGTPANFRTPFKAHVGVPAPRVPRDVQLGPSEQGLRYDRSLSSTPLRSRVGGMPMPDWSKRTRSMLMPAMRWGVGVVPG
ncbi:helix-turn-helix domain-containing protein [Streptomyces sp. NPDC059496]|uniref:helix-turn-helix domain-containing protein n=1 Tax=Streptomyces sp. NPDC059496 TaxID=3346851 RepID=UPI0036BF0E56